MLSEQSSWQQGYRSQTPTDQAATASSNLPIILKNNPPITKAQPTMNAALHTAGSNPDQEQHEPPGSKAQVTRDPSSLHAGSTPEPSKGKKRQSSNRGDRAQKVAKIDDDPGLRRWQIA